METPAARSFTALEDFFAEETKSQYVKGLSYTAIAGHAVAEHVERWAGEGKVELGGAVAQLTGAGGVLNAELDRELDRVVGVEHQGETEIVTADQVGEVTA